MRSQTDPVFPTIASIPASPLFESNGVYYLNQDTVVAVGDNGMVWRSIDGGFNYTSISTFGGTKNNNSVIMMNNYICIAGDSGTVTFSSNRGVSWANAAQAEPLINYHDVNFADTTFGVSVGDLGDAVVYKWVGGLGWAHIPTGLPDKLNAVVAFKTSASVFTDGEALAAGDNGVLSHYQSGSWTNSLAPVPTRINDLYLFPDNATVIAVGDSGLIMRSTDFGSNWNIVQGGTAENLNGVSNGINAGEIYAVGDSGVIYVSADNGLSFTRYTIGFTNSNLKSTSARNPRGAFAGSGSTLRTIVADTINIISVAGFPACPITDSIEVIFDYTGTFGTFNYFLLELSDASGSFANPTTIGMNTQTISPDTIYASILNNNIGGTGYRVRIKASEPLISSNDNGTDLTIFNGPGIPTISLSTDQTQLYTQSVSGITYEWLYNSVPIPFATDTVVATVGNGIYTLIVTNGNGCQSMSQYNYQLTGIFKPVASSKFQISPNPNEGIMHIVNAGSYMNSDIQIFNIIGEEVYKGKITGTKQLLNIEALNNGVYFLKIGSQIQRFIKN
ncbi:MAG: T9SS type A sorting domain-containing protein [Bacteroidota bacterium]|nr:T9SS type A sorting domain-containing protein [Bacteroidota bacterium]